jgi:hypothetical protein
MKTQSNELPKARRWQEGYEIPVEIEVLEVSDEYGDRLVYSYHRLIVPALTITDIESAIARDFEGDEILLADAIAAAKAVML